MNYRITELTTTQVKTLLQRKEIEKLLKADQLNQQRERGNVLLVSIYYLFSIRILLLFKARSSVNEGW